MIISWVGSGDVGLYLVSFLVAHYVADVVSPDEVAMKTVSASSKSKHERRRPREGPDVFSTLRLSSKFSFLSEHLPVPSE